MSKLSTEPVQQKLGEIISALSLKTTSDKLTTLLRIKSKCYAVKSIPKRSVGYRKIQIPNGFLKLIQLRILRTVLDVDTADYLYAFEKNKSVVDKAGKHTGKDYVVSLDIKDFFPSVRVDQVKAVFQSLGLDDVTSEIYAELCTYKFFLPQGAVTSPKISNFIVKTTFGPSLIEWATKNNLVLTVYADDVTFSLNVPEGVTDEVAYVNGLVHQAKKLIEAHGFKIHLRGKLKVMHKNFRQEVCGIVVNEKLSMKREQRRQLRAMVHRVVEKGDKAFSSEGDLNKSQLQGKIAWFQNFCPDQAARMQAALKEKRVVEKMGVADGGGN